MRRLTAVGLGAIATGVLAYAAATVTAIAAATGEHTLDISLGPIVVLGIEQLGEGGTETTLGPGLLLIALGGGVLNALAASVIGRRGARRRDEPEPPA